MSLGGVRWVRGKFKTSIINGVITVEGWVDEKKGLGFYRNFMDEWWIVHLNSGHGIINMTGESLQVLPVASEIAEAADWTFEGLDGWRNRNPDLPAKLNEIARRHPARRIRGAESATTANAPRDSNARKIGFERMDAEGEA